MKDITALIIALGWITGFVIAKGFWPTLFCILPFYSLYLVIEKSLQLLGWI